MKLAIALTLASVASVICNATTNTHIYRRKSVSDIKAYGKMGMKLKGKLRERFAIEAAELNPDESVVCSPLSALLPIGKLALTAGGVSTSELLAAAGAESRETLKKDFKQLIRSLKRLPGVTLDVAGRIYVSKDRKLNTIFEKEAKRIFGSSCKKINMQNPQLAAQTINNWIKTETHDMIQNLISPDQITPFTSVVLVNAVYFKANWVEPFRDISPGDFYTPSGVQQLTMMRRSGSYKYVKNEALDSQILAIPYEEEYSSFVIVLPNARDGLPVLLKALKVAPELLDKALKHMKTEMVGVAIPKFKVESKLNLEQLYKKIGVKGIFNRSLGLKEMVENEIVFVSTAIQKAVIEVTETGTTAAAASAITGVGSSRIEIFVEADHPFLFFVMSNGEQLFSGTFVKSS